MDWNTLLSRIAILALILAPLPHSLWTAAGIHSPYV